MHSKAGHQRWRAMAAAGLAALTLAGGAQAQTYASPDAKPYDDRLMRLAEILGAVHYLRELCGADDGQYWRERMKELHAAHHPRG